VATTADSYSVKRAAAAPVSTHAAFPAIVALWFAALLGIGSLVLPVALFERLVSASGLAAVLPSAAPPLGFTARAGIALAGAIIGALAGLALARKVARAHAPESTARSFAFDEPRRPISAHDELGEEGLDTAQADVPAQPHKRRTLAIAEDNPRSTYLQAVPLPGLPADEPSAFAHPIALVATAEPPQEAEPAPLELEAFAESADRDAEPESATNAPLDSANSGVFAAVETPSVQDQPMTDRRSFDDPQAPEPAADAVAPLHFAAPSLRRTEPIACDEEEFADEAMEMSFEEQPSAPHLSVIEDPGEPEETDDERPLEELGLVQLAARLGASLAKRKARLASRPRATAPAEVPPFTATQDFEAAEADDAARAIADFFGPAKSIEPAAEEPYEAEPAMPAVPASLRALSLESDEGFEDDGIAASFSLPLGAGFAGSEPVDEDETGEPDEFSEDSEYSSLLGMKNPFIRQQEFVRVEEPEDEAGAAEPAVTFPSPVPAPLPPAAENQAANDGPRPFDPPGNASQAATQGATQAAPRDPGEAERNLRAALATLQRMSGAA
jgi:hypothetical protein